MAQMVLRLVAPRATKSLRRTQGWGCFSSREAAPPLRLSDGRPLTQQETPIMAGSLRAREQSLLSLLRPQAVIELGRNLGELLGKLGNGSQAKIVKHREDHDLSARGAR